MDMMTTVRDHQLVSNTMYYIQHRKSNIINSRRAGTKMQCQQSIDGIQTVMPVEIKMTTAGKLQQYPVSWRQAILEQYSNILLQ